MTSNKTLVFLLTSLCWSVSAHAADLRCAPIQFIDESHSRTRCTFPEASLDDAYQAARLRFGDEAQYLQEQLPKTKFHDEKPDQVSVDYTPKAKSYTIDMGFAGGETVLTFTSEARRVDLTIDYYPD